MGKWALKAKHVLTPLRELTDAVVVIEDSRISAVLSVGSLPTEGLELVDLGDCYLVPGFVDIHHHGAMGVRAEQGVDAVKVISEYLPRTGTTSWLPTVSTLAGVEAIVRAKKSGLAGADAAGIHMEGPYLAPKRLPGDEDEVSQVDIRAIDRFLAVSDGLLRLVGIAPELPGALEAIRHLYDHGVVVAAAHTKISYEELMAAVDHGLRHVTHVYNVMSGFHHRRPGMVGGVLATDELTGELIADGYHVHPAAMKILIRCKGASRIALITDNTAYAGMPDGVYGNLVKKDGVVRRAGFDADTDHTLAGSVWPLDHNLRTLVSCVNVSLQDAITMATLTPASIVGIDHAKGSIAPGKDADLTVLDHNLVPTMTVVRGKTVYSKSVA